MKLSIAILHHPSRYRYLSYLTNKLPMAKVYTDTESQGIVFNSRRAWSGYDKDADFHLVLDDDAVLTDDFYNKAINFLELNVFPVEERIYSFYWGVREVLPVFVKQGWYKDNWCHHGISICIPTKFIDEMLYVTNCINYMNGSKLDNNQAFDTRIAIWAKNRGYDIVYPIPSLVQHGILESLVGHTRNRKAIYFEP